jgi:CheY-like chemotaxis protein
VDRRGPHDAVKPLSRKAVSRREQALLADTHAAQQRLAAALATVRALRPQVVLLDINLPGKCGYDIAREIRADPALADTLLVAVTGYGQEQDKRQARRAGFDHHLTKPVDENMLELLIDEALTD